VAECSHDHIVVFTLESLALLECLQVRIVSPGHESDLGQGTYPNMHIGEFAATETPLCAADTGGVLLSYQFTNLSSLGTGGTGCFLQLFKLLKDPFDRCMPLSEHVTCHPHKLRYRPAEKGCSAFTPTFTP
jgi:hypothetical protein